ncbi:MAG: sigma-54 dependent transcriptional regulator [Polyangiaceae bacterium]
METRSGSALAWRNSLADTSRTESMSHATRNGSSDAAGGGVGDTVPGVRDAVPPTERRNTLRPTSRGKIVGDHHSIREVLSTLDRVANSSCTVLVTGESGTGKELIVAALHDASPRKARNLVTVNCGAIPSELLESELFGHTRGAFTGAHAARKGFVAMAEGGTLFLDEVGELPLLEQVKLLRLLQNREYTPVGESRPVTCDVRIVAATNRDLESEVAAGRFREDLYYRLNVIHVHLPALRERPGDTELLAAHFLRVCAERSGRHDVNRISDAALSAIVHDDWSGNVRALENTIERAVLMARSSTVEVEDLPPRFRTPKARTELPPRPMDVASVPETVVPRIPDAPLPDVGFDLFAAVELYENTMIRQALARTGGNKNRAARLLNVNRTTLVEMIKRKKLG